MDKHTFTLSKINKRKRNANNIESVWVRTLHNWRSSLWSYEYTIGMRSLYKIRVHGMMHIIR